jgi:cephalosporin hydroxylase
LQRGVAGTYHRLLYYNPGRTWRDTRWLGHEVWKLPLDLWIYQEIVHEVRPALIVETGTRFGGTTTFLAHVLDLLGGQARIVSVDIDAGAQPPHPRIAYLDGSSTDPAIVAQVRSLAADGGPVLVILDSDHRTPHVRAEIAAYADLVTLGSYLIVEDTNTGGNPVQHAEVPDGGPLVAVRELLASDGRFEVDAARERFWVTLNPSGYLRRVR